MNGRGPGAGGGRFTPCERCGGSPAVHNPHQLNDAFVGHEYEAQVGVPVSIEITERGQRLIDTQAYEQARDAGTLDGPA